MGRVKAFYHDELMLEATRDYDFSEEQLARLAELEDQRLIDTVNRLATDASMEDNLDNPVLDI